MSKPILAGYDPARVDHAPVFFGVTAARITGAELVVACVESHRGGLRPPVIPLGAEEVLVGVGQTDGDLETDCAAAIEQIDAEARAWGVRVDTVRLHGMSAARALHEAAEERDAGLLTVGSSRGGRVLGGSTADRLMSGAPCPVAVVPREWTLDTTLDTIGVAFVDTDEAREALRGAHVLAARAGAVLRVITVVPEMEREERGRAEEELRHAVAALGDGVRVETEAVIGDPAATLIARSDELDLLVCGSRGYGPLRAVILGSVSYRVAEEAHCPVIVLPRGVRSSLQALVAETPAAVR